MRWLVDNQLPVALAIWLKSRGHDCVHVIDCGWDELTDHEIWSRASAEQRVVISKDQDFVFLSSRPDDTGRLVWVRIGNCRNAALTSAFDRVLEHLLKCFEEGQRIVEIR